jgi:hypothetical protein
MKKIIFLSQTKFLVALFLFIFCSNAQALNQYRCNGRVQYKPCQTDYINNYKPSLQNSIHRIAKNSLKLNNNKKKSDSLFAEVIDSNFRNLANKDGQWRGRLRGNGDIYLTLQILNQGKPQSTKYMGKVTLANGETSFNFISAAPKGKNWSWKILALAR